MSLFKRLMIYTFVLLATVLGVTTFSISNWVVYNVEDRLGVQTNNALSILASSLSMRDLTNSDILDETCLRLNPIADLLEFRVIVLRDAAGKEVCSQANTPLLPNAPAWFVRSIDIEVLSATQSVSQDWVNWELTGTPYGANAYDELWRLTVRIFWSVFCVLIAAGVFGTWALNRLLTPLRHVVVQAKNIGERRFTQIAIPNTREFADVAKSMNELSTRVQNMLADEAALLQSKKAFAEFDDTTGLLNRETFLDQFGARLKRENEESIGSVALIRIVNLAEMNREYGRGIVDNLLSDIGDTLNQLSDEAQYGGYCAAGRLNGADICAVATNESNAKNLADALQRKVMNVLSTHNIDERYKIAAACVEYQLGDNTGALLSVLDSALAQSEAQAGAPIVPALRPQGEDGARKGHQFWSDHLPSALTQGGLTLAWFPVRREDQSIIHLEGMARLTIGENTFNAGEFMPWVFRLGLGEAFDKAVVSTAMGALETQTERLHINLSADSVKGYTFVDWIGTCLDQSKADVARLGVEISETAVLASTASFDRLIATLKPRQVQVGIEHMGYRPEIIAKLGQLGPDYLKLDSLYTQDLGSNDGNRSVVSSFSSVAKSLGIDCIAEGINTANDAGDAFSLGIRGVSGRAIT